METTSSKWYDKKWLVILLCIFFFPLGIIVIWISNAIGKGWKIAYTLFIALIILINILAKESVPKVEDTTAIQNQKNAIIEAAKKRELKKAEIKNIPNWEYSNELDKMSSKHKFYAKCTSSNIVDFDFPYNGGSSFSITLINRGNGNEVLIGVSKGQFVIGLEESNKVRVRFDNEPAQSYSFNTASDASADVIFLNSENKFISKLKTSSKIIVEAKFYQEGNQLMEFNVAGLKWEH